VYKQNVNAQFFQSLGADIGKTIGQAATFQESWSKAFRALLADIVKLVLQMYVFRSLAAAFGGAGGGFMGALFSGLAGQKAAGGPVSGGYSYLVGESGPEIFTPGSSGAITPNSALRGHTVYQDFRGAVVTDDLLRKADGARMAMLAENRAVARAVSTVGDLQARR